MNVHIKNRNDLCLRCGNCCHYLFKGKLKRCKHLRKDNTCRRYPNHAGTRIDIGMTCTTRALGPYDYVGCPYNTDKPIFDIERFKDIK